MLFVGINGSGVEKKDDESEDGNEADEGEERRREKREEVRLGTNERLFQAADVCTYIRYQRLNHRIGPSSRLCIFTVKPAVCR